VCVRILNGTAIPIGIHLSNCRKSLKYRRYRSEVGSFQNRWYTIVRVSCVCWWRSRFVCILYHNIIIIWIIRSTCSRYTRKTWTYSAIMIVFSGIFFEQTPIFGNRVITVNYDVMTKSFKFVNVGIDLYFLRSLYLTRLYTHDFRSIILRRELINRPLTDGRII